jgi:EAL domain-containing protein (putative c-di-GMP-specific phosphodiesterase class I)/GGDEF domain-containing protein
MFPGSASVRPAPGANGARPSLAPATLLAVALAAMASAWLSRVAAFSAGELSLVWPPAGIAYGALLVLGGRGLAAATLGVVAWAIHYGADPPIIACAAAASVVGPLAGVSVMRWLLGSDRTDPNPGSQLRWLLALYAATIAVGAPLAALVGTAGLSLSASYAGESPAAIFVGYWLVESLGVLLFAPAVEALLRGSRGLRMPSFDAATIAAALALALLGVALIGMDEPGYARATTHLFLPLAAFCAIRRDALTSHWTLVACATLLLTVGALCSSHEAGQADRGFGLFSGALIVFSATGLAQVLQAVSADRRGALQAVARAAHEDPATGLANARGLAVLLEARIAAEPAHGFGLIGVRLRNLDAAVDLLDESEAGRVIASLQRSLAAAPGMSALGRPEPDRFVAIWSGADPASLEQAAETLLTELAAVRIAAGAVTMQLAPAIGAVWVPPRPDLNVDLLRVALREAVLDASLRVERPLRTATLDDGLLTRHRIRLAATERVREAILSRRLLLLAQPLAANRPECATDGHDIEVLVRLLDPQGAIITPAEFLPAVAAADLAIDLDRAVVASVFDWFVAHPDALARTAKCAINLSATSLADPEFAGFARAALQSRELPAGRFAFEITESSELLNPIQAAESIAQLRSLGFRVALDDFGTGLSTFDYLKKLPVDYLKIDGSFVRDLETDPIDADIIASIVQVAQRRGLRTVAEYVSTPELRERVTRLGVDYSQGYAISEPVPIAQALAVMTPRPLPPLQRADSPPTRGPEAAAPAPVLPGVASHR